MVQVELWPFRRGEAQLIVPLPPGAVPETSQSPATKVAVAVTSAPTGTVQPGVVLPAQGPADQPVKRWPAAVEAVRTTLDPSRKAADWEAQAGPQLMADGLERMVPAPPPALVTVSVRSVPT